MNELNFWLLVNCIVFVALTALCALIGALTGIAEFWTLGFYGWAAFAWTLLVWLDDETLERFRSRFLKH